MRMISIKILLPDSLMRILHIRDFPDIPDDDYGLVECFCDDLECDCRRVSIAVLASSTNQIMASISYGWESKEFYKKWIGNPNDETDQQGPYLDPLNTQSELCHLFLQIFEEQVLADPSYLEQLKQRYNLFKAALKRTNSKPQLKLVKPLNNIKKGRKRK